MQKKYLKFITSCFAVAFMAMAAFTQPSLASSGYNTDNEGVGIHRYDPVAIYLDRSAIVGNKNLKADWKGVTFHFASKFNRAAFMSNPDYFVTRFDGYCAFGASMGLKLDVNPQAWAIVDQKLYMFNNKRVRDMWMQAAATNIAKGKENWATAE